LSFSPKGWIETPRASRQPSANASRAWLRYPSRSDDLTLPMADGGVADLTRYPFAERHEDLVMLVEKPGNELGWAAAVRPDMASVFLTLKNPADYPVTILWFSNGGRDFPPWNGRHTAVLGMEEGRTYFASGHKASIAPNPLSDAGIPTALALAPGGDVRVRNVIGSVDAGSSTAVISVEPGSDVLTLTFDDGNALGLPYDSGFLA
jgi:hypothetical protein